jgi:putative cardiolipin synthase
VSNCGRARADPAREDRQRRRLGYSLSSLHTKAFAVDRRKLFIGSFNWDPRSVNINTEMGVYLDAPDMTALVLKRLEHQLPNFAYRLRLNEKGRIEWLSQEDGEKVLYKREPKTSFWKRFADGFYKLLPIEVQL